MTVVNPRLRNMAKGKFERKKPHAIQCARKAISEYEQILVLSGDVPLIQADTLQHLMTLHLAEGAAMTILTAEPADPTGYGRIVRHTPDRPEVEAIVEQKALKPEQKSIGEINSGIYAFKVAPLLKHLDKLTNKNAHEYARPKCAHRKRRWKRPRHWKEPRTMAHQEAPHRWPDF